MLIGDINPLAAIHLLDFRDNVLVKSLLSERIEDIVTGHDPIGQALPGMDVFSGMDEDHLAFIDKLLGDLTIVSGNNNALFAAQRLAHADGSVDLGDQSDVFGATGFEELGDAGQTPGNVFGFDRRFWLLGQDVGNLHFLAIVDEKACLGIELIAKHLSPLGCQQNRRLVRRRDVLVEFEAGITGHFIELL